MTARPAVLQSLPVRRPLPLPAYMLEEERTAILRPSNGKALSWADIARDRLMSRPSADVTTITPLPVPAPVVRLADKRQPAPKPKIARSVAPKASKEEVGPPAPWDKLHDRWGLNALIGRDHEAVCKVRRMPARVGQLLKCAEWKGSSISHESETTPIAPWRALDRVPGYQVGIKDDRAREWFAVEGPVPPPSVREWIVVRHPSGAVLRLDASKIEL